MVLRRTGLDDLPLLVVLGLSATLVAWAGLGRGRGSRVVDAHERDGATGQGAAAELEHAPQPQDAEFWKSYVSELAVTSISPERRLVATDDVGTSESLADPVTLVGAHATGGFESIECVDSLGHTRVRGWMRDGVPQDRWTIWHDSGTRYFSGRFERGEPDGVWTWWHENGQLSAEGAFQSGLAEGLWLQWHTNGADASVTTYRAGELDGETHEWWPSGTSKLDGAYEQGEREGPWESWYENGQLRAQGVYRSGLREGAWQEYHDNGQAMLEATYRRGRAEGVWREWYRNGQLKSEGMFDEGRREGAWRFFEFNGDVDPRTGDYAEGHRLRE